VTPRLRFETIATSTTSNARAGVMHTARGAIRTPVFMPVGTVGTVKSLDPDQLRTIGTQILLGNTYHLYLRPGAEVLRRFGGLHRFMAWDGPILTDSGGFQFYSIARLARFSDDGVAFQSHIDGSRHTFTPESCMAMQGAIGSDIMMVLDQCPALPATRGTLEQAVRRTTAWAQRCVEAARDLPGAVFAIAQGGTDVALRRSHVEDLAALDVEGIALGGLAVGETPSEMYDTVGEVAPSMPVDRPRYLMGVGRPVDLIEAIERGIDMFDCVMPTRNARNAQVFGSMGKINLRNARFATDERPLDPSCACPTCSRFSRAYVHHLFRSNEMLGPHLATMHNVWYYQSLVQSARDAIVADRWSAWKSAVYHGWNEEPAR
jgi:queuine tRNA-ribosyltransferase